MAPAISASGAAVTPPAPGRPFNRTHQFAALIDAAHRLEEDGRLPHEVLESLEPGTSMGGARPKVTVEDDHKIWLAKLPERGDRHNVQRIEYATLELARAAGLRVCRTASNASEQATCSCWTLRSRMEPPGQDVRAPRPRVGVDGDRRRRRLPRSRALVVSAARRRTSPLVGQTQPTTVANCTGAWSSTRWSPTTTTTPATTRCCTPPPAGA